MWILNQYENELVHVEGSREIFISDCFDIEVSGENYEINDNTCALGTYSPSGRTTEVFSQLTDWVAAGAQGVFRMPER